MTQPITPDPSPSLLFYTPLVCPVCKSGEHLLMRSTRTVALGTVWRNKVVERAYLEPVNKEQPNPDTDVLWVQCSNCSWNVSPGWGEDPWAELVEAP